MAEDKADMANVLDSPPSVVPLDHGIRLSRGNTRASSLYAAKAQRLEPVLQRRHQILESLLFESKRRLTCCTAGHLDVLEGQFDCRQGTILFYWSRKCGQFVLLDFWFGGGGNGGVPIPADCSPNDAADAPVGVTGRAIGWAASSTTRPPVMRISFSQNHFGKAGVGQKSKSSTASHSVWECSSGRRGSNIWGKGSRTIREHRIKASILARFILVPEQLQNPFARSIMAGEALCRAFTSSAFGRSPHFFDDRPIASDLLLVESVSLLNLLFAGSSPGAAAEGPFMIAKALKDSLLADDRLLPIVRIELTAHLSVRVARKARRLAEEHSDLCAKPHGRILDVMKAYSMLADFACLSMHIPNCGRGGPDIRGVLEEYEEELAVYGMTNLATGYVEFGPAVSLLLSDYCGEPEKNGWIDMHDAHRRAIEMTRALLDMTEE